MTERNYDPDLAPLIALLPDISDLSTAEKIQAVRSEGLAFGEPPAKSPVPTARPTSRCGSTGQRRRRTSPSPASSRSTAAAS